MAQERYRLNGLTESTPRPALSKDEIEIDPPGVETRTDVLPRPTPNDLTQPSISTLGAVMGNGKTTWVGIIKVIMGLLATMLAGSGIDIASGHIAIAPGTSTLVIVALIGYFLLSGIQAYLTQDADGLTGKTTAVGIVKALSGVLATVLMYVGVDVGTGGEVQFDHHLGIWAMALYLLYLVLSAIQAYWTRDRTTVYD